MTNKKIIVAAVLTAVFVIKMCGLSSAVVNWDSAGGEPGMLYSAVKTNIGAENTTKVFPPPPPSEPFNPDKYPPAWDSLPGYLGPVEPMTMLVNGKMSPVWKFSPSSMEYTKEQAGRMLNKWLPMFQKAGVKPVFAAVEEVPGKISDYTFSIYYSAKNYEGYVGGYGDGGYETLTDAEKALRAVLVNFTGRFRLIYATASTAPGNKFGYSIYYMVKYSPSEKATYKAGTFSKYKVGETLVGPGGSALAERESLKKADEIVKQDAAKLASAGIPVLKFYAEGDGCGGPPNRCSSKYVIFFIGMEKDAERILGR